jgi:hypothetical protein
MVRRWYARGREIGPLVGLGLLAASLLPGCNIIKAAAFFLSPPQVQKTEFKLTEGKLAVLIEAARPEEDNPVFAQALYERLVEVFRDNKVKAQLVPLEDIAKLRLQEREFAKWSLQRVGRAVHADQVLSVRIEQLQLRESPDSPILHPTATLRLKVIDPNAPAATARVWPKAEERGGREVQRSRHDREALDPMSIDAEAAKLGKDIAWLVAAPFYDVDLETKTPWEP